MKVKNYRELIAWQRAMEQLMEVLGEVGRLLNGLMTSLVK